MNCSPIVCLQKKPFYRITERKANFSKIRTFPSPIPSDVSSLRVPSTRLALHAGWGPASDCNRLLRLFENYNSSLSASCSRHVLGYLRPRSATFPLSRHRLILCAFWRRETGRALRGVLRSLRRSFPASTAPPPL